MLQLRREQLEAIQQDDTIFVEWYVEDIMKQFFAHLYFSLTAAGKREMVLNGRRWARAYGLSTAEAQGHFISLMWDIGPNFHQFPGFRDILERTNIVEMEKIDLIYSDNITHAQSQAALQGADDSYWYLGPSGDDKE